MIRLRSMLSFTLITLILPPALAADESGNQSIDPTTRLLKYAVDYEVKADGRFVETRSYRVKVLKEQAIQEVKQTTVSYSTSIQQIEILEAYTTKPDGRRIDAPKSNFQVEANKGNGDDKPVFSDITTLTAVFPDIAVGDTATFSYRLTATEPIYPNHFSTSEYFTRNAAMDDVRVTITTPVSLWTHYRANDMEEVRNGESNGRRTLEWHFSNPEARKSRRRDYSIYDTDKEPGIEFSTFRSWADVAAAYGQRAVPKAAVTERIRSLADDIARTAKTPRDTARLLYEWVAQNITYAGHCIGLGAVVPHDLDFVLDNRMGDCKDHATLLQALLAAKGIDADQALVDTGSAYRLGRIPLVSKVDHVFNYIPSLNLYADSTSDSTPFGMLPFADSGKPVLHVKDYREGTRTPVLRPGSNLQVMKTVSEILPDGTVKADISIELTGQYAVSARARMRNMTKEQETEIVPNMFRNSGYVASGQIEKEDPKELLDRYRYGARFQVQGLLPVPGPSTFSIAPMFYNEAPVMRFVGGGLQHDDEAEESACSNGKSIEEYSILLPRNMKILNIPDNLKLSNSFLSYEATYALKGRKLSVKRIFDDRTEGNVCSRQSGEAYRDFAKKVMVNLRAQVMYK